MLRVLLLSFVSLLAVPAGQAADAYSPAAVKAAYVLRFAAYVEWPAPLPEGDDFIVAVYGDDEMATQLERIAENRVLLGRPVRVRRINTPAGADGARIVFVGQGRRRGSSVVRRFARPGVLLLAEEEGGLVAGAAINLLRADNRLRFEVSTAEARRADLKVSSELLAVAARVVQ